MTELKHFIVKAKANSYVNNAPKCLPSRQDAHEIQFQEERYQYVDSYFGGTDFLGQEVVYLDGKAVWAMNYYGRIITPSLYDGEQAGKVICQSLSLLYQSGEFLKNFEHTTPWGHYHDSFSGDIRTFTGYEWITLQEEKVYELHYHGGLIKD
ncbi:DUF5680 domain-containing protein [Thaumasiovibrio subtropicus]|uniref:DUF5680 domain-containing protein n=1 Tax=Thaumasiovibrio subtropicus TaxID=1891207 RepID=UPI000B35100A|nr:DUF5680 domain-containing protein [Thaumasiovibrio subtropicus]